MKFTKRLPALPATKFRAANNFPLRYCPVKIVSIRYKKEWATLTSDSLFFNPGSWGYDPGHYISKSPNRLISKSITCFRIHHLHQLHAQQTIHAAVCAGAVADKDVWDDLDLAFRYFFGDLVTRKVIVAHCFYL
jgi:hypothetical protein